MHKRKMNVGSVIGTIVLGGLMIALMIYTATRTVHFLQETFPASMSYVAYLALAAFDGGIIGWTIFATATAEGALQRGVAYLMIFVDTLGVILTTIADTTTVSAQNGLTKVDPYMATVGMWGSIAIIVLNVVAIIVTHLVAPHHVRKFELENVHDSIHQLTMQHIKDRAIEIAPRIAAEHADHWVHQTIQDVVGSLPASSQTRQLASSQIQQLPSPVVDADPVACAANECGDHVADPYDMAGKVAKEKEQGITYKPIGKMLKDAISFKLPASAANKKKIEAEAKSEEEEIVEDDEEVYEVLEPQEKSPSTWTDEEWAALYEKIDAFAFNDIWRMYKGDVPYPWEKPAPTKKSTSKKKTGKVTRREVLGMENQDD